jgi:hypothetical protein
MGIVALCNFIAAALTYQDSGRLVIVSMQVLAGLLMVTAAIKFGRKG